MKFSPGTNLTGTKGTRVTVESKLDVGAFVIVYEGKTNKGGKCVIKQSFPEQIKKKRIKVERKVLERLGNHPQIPSLIDYNERKSPPFIVTSYINGENLKSKLKKQNGSFKTLPEQKVKDYGIKLLKVLNYLHQQDNPVIHRGVKPKHVMVNSKDEVHLIDYGSAVVEWVGSNVSGIQILSPGFGTPEQGNPHKSVDVRSDIYGVGTTMFFLLTGQDLIHKTTRKQCVKGSRGNTRLKKPSKFNSSISRKMDEIVRKATEIDLDDRFQTSQEMITELKGQGSPSTRRRGAELQLGGKIYSLDSMLRSGQTITIGSKHGVNKAKANVKNDIQIDSSYVSDIHAEIELDKSGNYWLKDKGSNNRTAVNPGSGWNEVSKDQSWNLHSGDKIALAYDKDKGPCITLIFRET